MHNAVVYDAELTHPWSADNAGMADAPALLQNPLNTEFTAFANSTSATGSFASPDGTVWTRVARTMAFNPGYPILYITDNFTGPSAGSGKTLTWNLMAGGPVNTPAGSGTPAPRFSNGCPAVPAQLPSNGTTVGPRSGLQGFNFTGVNWPKHATGGINWDLYTLSSSATQQFFIGNWGHGCHSSREAAEYSAANGTPFAETQHILRIHDTGPFKTMILPYRKTETPARTVTQQTCGVQIAQGSETTCFNDSAALYTNGAVSVLTVYDNSMQSAFGVTVSGGPQEVVIQSGQIVWTVSGVSAGTRSLTLPGTWYANQAVAQSGNTFSQTFAGGAQTSPATVIFTPMP